MINSSKVSIIIPVYGVEKYLRTCIDSVLRQTYKNIEIILVDDESPDGCPQICDEYTAKDRRIHTIHKPNGGLSSARNAGMDISTGQYVAFVDSDDYIEKDMISFLYNNLVNSKSDISTCGFNFVYDNGAQRMNDVSNQVYILETDDALKTVLYNEHSSLHACGKLFKMSLFKGTRFPEGKYYEDVGTTYKIFSKSKRVIICTSKKYNYLLRRDSITGSVFSRNTLDSLVFAEEILLFMKKCRPAAIYAAEGYLFNTAVNVIYLILASRQHRIYQKEIAACKKIVLHYCKSVAADSNVSKRVRIYAQAAKLHIYVLYVTLIIQHYIKLIIKNHRY